jgi:hypothetical protein
MRMHKNEASGDIKSAHRLQAVVSSHSVSLGAQWFVFANTCDQRSVDLPHHLITSEQTSLDQNDSGRFLELQNVGKTTTGGMH